MSSFIDHTLLQFTFSSVESISIVRSNEVKVRLFCTFDLDLESLYSIKVTSQYGHFQYKQIWSNLAYFRLPIRQKAWKIYTCEFVAKAEFFSNEGKEAHICANSAEGWRGEFTEVCQAISQSQQGRVNQLYNVGYWSHYTHGPFHSL